MSLVILVLSVVGIVLMLGMVGVLAVVIHEITRGIDQPTLFGKGDDHD